MKNTINAIYSPSFNALYMPSTARIESRIGKKFAEATKNAKPTLEAFAEDFDIHIMPYKYSYEDRGLAMKVEMPTKNPFKHFLTKLSIKYQTWNKHMDFPSSSLVRLAPLVGFCGVNTVNDIKELLEDSANELSTKVADMNGISDF